MVAHDQEFKKGERKFNMAGKSLNGYEIKKLWRNDGGGRFTDVSIASGAGDVHDGRGYAACDFDRDGDLDFFLRNYKTDSVYLRNDGVTGHWLLVRPYGTKSNRDAIGARIEVTAGGATQTRWLTCGSGYLSQQPNEAYFGLGAATRVERIRVTWPSGLVQEFGGADADRHLKVVEGRDGIEILETHAQPVLAPADLGQGDPLFAALAGADIRDREGKRVDVTKLAGVATVNFWATWCNVCRSEIGDLNALARAHAGQGSPLVGVAVLDPQGPDLEKTCAELKPEFTVLTITREEYDRLYGKDAAVPRTIVLERGRVLAAMVGRVRPYLVKSYLIGALRTSK